MKKVILDADTGVDDAVGIMLAVSCPDIEVLAITCVSGNTSAVNACHNTARVLTHCQKQIPIYLGASEGILGIKPDLESLRFIVHGNDGLGDADWSHDIDTDLIQSEHAVNALIRIVKENSGEITLITLGPLTNIALAIQKDSEFIQHLKRVYIMGGNTDGTDPHLKKEFNFSMDPDAASIVFQNIKGKVDVLSRDVSDTGVFSKEWTAEALKVNTSNAHFILKTIKYRLDSKDFVNIRIPDFMLVAACIHPKTVTRSEDAYADVIVSGESRSFLEIDWESKTSNVTHYMDMSTAQLQEIFVDLLQK